MVCWRVAGIGGDKMPQGGGEVNRVFKIRGVKASPAFPE